METCPSTAYEAALVIGVATFCFLSFILVWGGMLIAFQWSNNKWSREDYEE